MLERRCGCDPSFMRCKLMHEGKYHILPDTYVPYCIVYGGILKVSTCRNNANVICRRGDAEGVHEGGCGRRLVGDSDGMQGSLAIAELLDYGVAVAVRSLSAASSSSATCSSDHSRRG